MLRQRAVPIVLAFMLLLSQHFGMAHLIQHIGVNLSPHASQDTDLPSGLQCAQCLTFTAFGSALPATPPVSLALLLAGRTSAPTTVISVVTRTIRSFDSRAPPFSLR